MLNEKDDEYDPKKLRLLIKYYTLYFNLTIKEKDLIKKLNLEDALKFKQIIDMIEKFKRGYEVDEE